MAFGITDIIRWGLARITGAQRTAGGTAVPAITSGNALLDASGATILTKSGTGTSFPGGLTIPDGVGNGIQRASGGGLQINGSAQIIAENGQVSIPRLVLGDGTAAAPAYSFVGAARGFYRANTQLVFADVSADIWWTSASSICMRSNGTYGFANGGSSTGSPMDTGASRNAAGIWEFNNGTPGQFRDLRLRNLIASGTVRLIPLPLGSLPSASASGVGATAFINDATTPAWGAPAVGGGSIGVPVYVSESLTWTVG